MFRSCQYFIHHLIVNLKRSHVNDDAVKESILEIMTESLYFHRIHLSLMALKGIDSRQFISYHFLYPFVCQARAEFSLYFSQKPIC